MLAYIKSVSTNLVTALIPAPQVPMVNALVMPVLMKFIQKCWDEKDGSTPSAAPQ